MLTCTSPFRRPLLDRFELRLPRPGPGPGPALRLGDSWRRHGGGSPLGGRGEESDHERGEVDSGGFAAEGGVGEEEVDSAGLEAVVGAEWVGAEGGEVGAGEEHVLGRPPGELPRRDWRREVFHVAGDADDPHAVRRRR